MSSIDMNTLAYLQAAADPSSTTFGAMMTDLLDAAAGKMAITSVKGKTTWARVFPFCGTAVENRTLTERFSEFSISNYATYTQGVLSLAAVFKRMTDVFQEVVKNPSNRTLFMSSYAREFCDMYMESDPGVSTVDYGHTTGVPNALLRRRSGYSIMVYDHTTLGGSLQATLEMAHAAGVRVVEGLFWYSAAVDFGWDGVFGEEKISVQHTESGLSIGPADDPTRVLFYSRSEYAQFTHPDLLSGTAAQFYYELKVVGGLARYTAYNVGPVPRERVTFRLPYSTDPDLIVVSIDRRFATGVFSTTVESNRTSVRSDRAEAPLFSKRRDFFFQARRKLFEDCVIFLIGKPKGADLMTEATRYVTAHNYSDLFEGSRVIEAYSAPYTDALCLALVCAIQAYTFRYDLTRESMRTLVDTKFQANVRVGNVPLGGPGKLIAALAYYSKYAIESSVTDVLHRAASLFQSSDLIPGVFYDIYIDRTYTIGDTDWVSGIPREYSVPDEPVPVTVDDPVTDFLGGKVDTSAPSYLHSDTATSALNSHLPEQGSYKFQPVADPVKKFQEVYDSAFPGNSVADLANVAELRKTRDVDMRLDFVGRIQPNMDRPKPEALHPDMPIRTAALPVGRGGLLDAIFASAKRNFSAPDIHTVSDAFDFARRLVGEFIDHACIPGARNICRQYRKNPLTFNVTSYCEWAAGKSDAYLQALMGEMPDEMMTLGLNKYTTILKGRIKPKLSTTATLELGQPQVVVHQTKKETALFSSVFRKVFERFDSLLKDEYKSAGRSSDDDISNWASRLGTKLLAADLLEGDSSMYDKSQGLLAMMIEVELLQELGCAPEVTDLLRETFVGGVTAATAGLMFLLALQRKSGHGDTMLGNIVYNAVSIGHCVGWSRIIACIIKGDDNLIALHQGSLRGDDAAVIASKMGLYFNLETKVILHEVPGFSSGGFAPVGDRVLYFPDPLKLLELLGERQVDPSLTIKEQFASYVDRVRPYAVDGAARSICEWTRSRYKTDADVVGLIDAFLTVASDFELFSSIKNPTSL